MSDSKQRKARVAVAGATGLAGQQYLPALADHPDLEVTMVAASRRSAGKPYLLVSHNTKMGAAKGCILLAEHLLAEGVIER